MLQAFFPVGHARNTFTGMRPGHILTRCPNHLNWQLSKRRSSGSTLSFSCMSELCTLSLKTHFGRLYPRSHSFGHYPELMTIGEGTTITLLLPHWSHHLMLWLLTPLLGEVTHSLPESGKSSIFSLTLDWQDNGGKFGFKAKCTSANLSEFVIVNKIAVFNRNYRIVSKQTI